MPRLLPESIAGDTKLCCVATMRARARLQVAQLHRRPHLAFETPCRNVARAWETSVDSADCCCSVVNHHRVIVRAALEAEHLVSSANGSVDAQSTLLKGRLHAVRESDGGQMQGLWAEGSSCGEKPSQGNGARLRCRPTCVGLLPAKSSDCMVGQSEGAVSRSCTGTYGRQRVGGATVDMNGTLATSPEQLPTQEC